MCKTLRPNSFVFVETARESDWDNVVACHHGEMVATTWSTHRFCMGKHKLLPPRLEQAKHQDKQQFHKKTTAVVKSFLLSNFSYYFVYVDIIL